MISQLVYRYLVGMFIGVLLEALVLRGYLPTIWEIISYLKGSV